MDKNDRNTKKVKKTPASNCEDCMYYDYDEEYESYVCIQNLDQDEMTLFLAGRNNSCPYYKYYDEYKFVQKQN